MRRGWEEAKEARLKDLLSKAHKEGIISVQELNTLHHLRRIRKLTNAFSPSQGFFFNVEANSGPEYAN